MDLLPSLSGITRLPAQPARLGAREHVAAPVAAGSVTERHRLRVDALAVEVDEAEARRGTRG